MYDNADARASWSAEVTYIYVHQRRSDDKNICENEVGSTTYVFYLRKCTWVIVLNEKKPQFRLLFPYTSSNMSLSRSNGKTVLVSGINGYIASNIGLDLLRLGYHVRGTARSASSKDDLLEGAFKGYENHYEHVVVANITEEGAFDEAVRGTKSCFRNQTHQKTEDEFWQVYTPYYTPLLR